MSRVIRALALVCALPVFAVVAHAQSCLGYPAFATGPLNLSASGTVGGRFWGSGIGLNLGRRTGGGFGGVGVNSTSYIDDPKETRFTYVGIAGYEQHNADQMIWCPIATAAFERGNQIDLIGGGHAKTNGTVFGAGVGISFEIAGRGRFSVDPFLNGRYIVLNSEVTGDSTHKFTEQGITFALGLGIRPTDAVQITPSFSGSTLPNADLVFNLRISVALQFKKD